MILPEQFLFLRPWWLLAFIPLAWILRRISRSSLTSRSWEAVVDRQLLPYILIGNTTARGLLPTLLLAICGTLAILALAGPAWEKLPQPVFSTRTALVIALDLSRSMNAADIEPSRLERARFKISDILAKRAEGQTALLAYAGDAFAVTPLTDDVETINSQLGALTPDIMPAQGNRTDLAITMALELLKKGGASKGDILLITDEVDPERSSALARLVMGGGYRLSILGVGTPEGAPIVKPDGGFMTDDIGEIIVPKLDEGRLRQLADEGGGRYVQISLDDSDIETLDVFFSSAIGEEDVAETEFETDVWREEGPWLLIVLIPLAALVFRRGYLIILVLTCLPFPRTAQAFEWDTLWMRPDQRAAKAFEQGDAARAAELFRDPAWKGAAHYKAGNFDEAIRSLEGLEQIENNYNLGNALARKGQYEAAIALYDKVLSENPDHADAQYNKELLEKELEQQQQQQQQQQDQDQQQKDENQQQDEQNQQQNDQQQDQQENQDQQQQQQEDQQQQQQQEQQSDDQEESDAEAPKDEQQQATEQWLRRIPDDPGGLLRRKFLYQYQQRDHDKDPGEKTW